MTQNTPVGGIDSGKRHLDLAIYPGTDRIRVENMNRAGFVGGWLV